MARTALAALEPDPLAAQRDRLRDVIGRRQAAEQRLASLEQGQERAHEQLREANHRLAEAQAAVRTAQREEPARLAEQFVSGETDEDPIGDAKLIVTAAQAEVTRLESIESALATEIGKVQSSLSTVRGTQYSVMAEIIVASEEYKFLIEQHRAAWKQLRSVKVALRTVSTALHSQLPQRYIDEASLSEPFEERIGFPVDANLVSAWASALAALENDADVELPLFG